MNPAQLLTHFEEIADAPDAIPRLRSFILDLAVRGKLVAQNLDDEPAFILLKSIRIARTKMGLREINLPPNAKVSPFQLPTGWVWTSVGEVCSKTGSGSTPRGGREVYTEAGVPFLRSQNVYDDGLRMDEVAFIDKATHARMAGTSVKGGDLLLNITGGSIGRCCIVPNSFDEANVSQHVAILRPVIPGMQSFLHALIRSSYFQSFVVDEQTGAGRGGLPKNRMDRIAVALPPFEEQGRIVDRVSELMALCDALEKARCEREQQRDGLARSTFTRLNTPDRELFRSDVLVVLDNLAALTRRPDQVKQLRAVILNLALRGKLVSQDECNEPVSDLLARTEPEGPRQIGFPTNNASSRSENEAPFTSPRGWQWLPVQRLLASGREISYGIIKLETEPRVGGVPTLRCSDVKPGFIDLSGVRRVSEEVERDFARTRLVGGELVINIRGTLGGVSKVSAELAGFNVAREVAVIPVSENWNIDFLVYAMLAPYFWDQIQASLRGIAYKGLNLGLLRRLLIAVPPVEEQVRIVRKLDELMALCDRLEVGLRAGEEHRSGLLGSILDYALQPTVQRDEAA